MTRIPVTSEQHWHSLRARHIGGTETAALFGLSPYVTPFELYHRKTGAIPEPKFSDNERVFWGKFLEPSIAAGVADIRGWQIAKVTDYMVNDRCPGHGASLDYEILGDERGPGILEIKTVDFLTFRNEWEDEKPPVHYELQLQTQFACSQYSWGVIAVLIGGNDMRIFDYEARPKSIAKIETAVAEFWSNVRASRAPSPDFSVDHEAVSTLYGKAGGGWTNLTGNERAEALCRAYVDLGRTETDASKQRKAARAEILTLLGNADTATCGNFKISAGVTDQVTVPEYVREAHRKLRITEKSKSLP